ncbi:glyoxylase-like metal-dependent hydrolase (beta-lactamase superfamily II) [Chitinivorax tropicus]|uniref:Glyoxylase-like metal-dependent hydrolase (Beta-lactamase superfamily II) n=1 Tax=Chitinivorax tropicus TaxID=714531 RepID=A0A840MNM0_9PROT|nr:MBL fold metallo-hydrolase [Chitinivorax tropicus]MBB5020238.1 glyoxylase-like metal-dependent hydrolase (beta-lactamase superfamily II) [Chitinivorax tropicus]
MPFRIIPVTPFQQNCSLLWCEHTRDAALIDPGGDVAHLLSIVAEEQVNLTKLILTHGHLDHVGGTAELGKRLSLPIEGPHPGDQYWIDQLPIQAAMFGFGAAESFTPTRWLKQGDVVEVGQLRLEVRHCPGHTPGHVILFEPSEKLAFVGDVLFAGSIGRTDFPGGNHAQLLDSIRNQLWSLGDDTRFVPGHGPMSTIGQERATNPFVADRRFG